MNIILDTADKKVVSETISYSDDHTITNTMAVFNFGGHATYKIRNASDAYPDVWKVGELLSRENFKGISTEIRAEFVYRPMEFVNDTYKPLRTVIRMRDKDQTVEERRIIFFEKDGSIEQDKVEVASLIKTSVLGYGTIIYTFDKQTGNYVSEANAIYKGQIANDGILDRVNFLVAKADSLVSEDHKTL